ncbi:MurR/RpiR family transcriptional regulator [Paenibacillus apiarius]|uniref:MurR/RpiR family transcriptional regulator n=1 Tax=Paenibacillus apiarius TaxID=46240 RepID=A0ABT4DLV3_9BACL|nr:MurR/RpiR family transcriptional regulator [Paenibacillus apiarius]MCY9517733.1 MurR/RpiR family transcriptional regulator [Paenibacillus apiarius]MCY9518333.1 MurR/RpiR family transcriptional regulator [Paenibacillus apiarius]MCY9551266.1 MurR/RpiR family transcriptional regulator [Paenibacillus apiarius]MCY9558420.1 MurR/RpiR family transcriptional regulator [Paenibacillus apiarius]MCY9687071.1 MurR/RpiR family transcriptional regulator [Paenibacillus apiarius]
MIVSPTKGGLVMLSDMVAKLPPSEKKIAKYILEHPQEAVSLTASELGVKCHASSAAVIRLCKSLKLKGFQELKLRIVGDLNKSENEGYRDIKPNETVDAVLAKMTNNSIQALRETSEIVNLEDMAKVVDALIRARNIHFFGVGASSIIAMDAQQKFLRINKPATAFTDVHVVAMNIANMAADDVMFGISYSGETLEVYDILRLANAKGCRTVSLTHYGNSIIASEAQLNLYISATKEATFRSAATSSRLAQLHIIDVLFMCVASHQYDGTVQYLDQTREAIRFIKEQRS